jgi:hypothetical protein
VEQPAGDVFYRVQPGATFRVHTPAGEVAVLGTCFRVKVEDAVNGRDLKVGVVGAAVGAAALVSVYEGKVAVSRGGDRVTLTAGESARADERGIRRGEGATAAEGARADADGGRAIDPVMEANANLAESVRDYKRRLEAIESQKAVIAQKLAQAEQKLSTVGDDGGAGSARSQFDLTQDDWKELAREGTVKARFPCLQPRGKDGEITGAELQKAGFAPGDAPVLQQALEASRARLWATIRPLCVNALQGDAAMADKLGGATCAVLVRDIAASSGVDVSEDMREVAEIRAGLRQLPEGGGDPVVKMTLALTRAGEGLEQDLAKQLGPEDAHRLLYSGNTPGCWNNDSWGVGPRP